TVRSASSSRTAIPECPIGWMPAGTAKDYSFAAGCKLISCPLSQPARSFRWPILNAGTTPERDTAQSHVGLRDDSKPFLVAGVATPFGCLIEASLRQRVPVCAVLVLRVHCEKGPHAGLGFASELHIEEGVDPAHHRNLVAYELMKMQVKDLLIAQEAVAPRVHGPLQASGQPLRPIRPDRKWIDAIRRHAAQQRDEAGE